MKSKFIISMLVLFLSSGYSHAKDTLFVTDKGDLRLTAYQDSLKRWSTNERQKVQEIKMLDATGSHSTYEQVARKLGYSPTEYQSVWSKGKRSAGLKYEQLNCCNHFCVYGVVVHKPKRPVSYRLTRVKTVTTVNIDKDGNQTVEKTSATVFITK